MRRSRFQKMMKTPMERRRRVEKTRRRCLSTTTQKKKKKKKKKKNPRRKKKKRKTERIVRDCTANSRMRPSSCATRSRTCLDISTTKRGTCL